MTSSITAAELKDIMEEQGKVCVLDVRRKTDFDRAPETIDGAVWLDPEKVEEWSATLSEKQALVVYCVKGGSVSQSVANALQEKHPGVRFLEGGILGWQEQESRK